MNTLDVTFPGIFSNPETVNTLSESELCSEMLIAWGMCSLGEVPDNFGQVMVECGKRLNIVPTAEGVQKFCREKGWLSND